MRKIQATIARQSAVKPAIARIEMPTATSAVPKNDQRKPEIR